MNVECLICKKIVEWIDVNFYWLFCFECCKFIDFGVWVNEEYWVLVENVFFDDLDQGGEEICY